MKKTDDYHQAAIEACRVAVEKRAQDVVLLDLHKLTAAADYFVLATGRSQAHARGLAEAIEESLDEFPLERRGVEGYPHAPWILLDYYGVVVHIFLEEERDYYHLERIWSEAEMYKFEEGAISYKL